MIPRAIAPQIHERLQPGKVVVVYGPRQVGKTTLLREIVRKSRLEHLWLNGDETTVQDLLSQTSSATLGKVVKGHDLVVIDEAQHVDDIGRKLKIIVDTIPDVRLLVSGSSAFDLARQVGEPLVGRKWQYTLYPIAQLELARSGYADWFTRQNEREERLIYGAYPAVFGMDNWEQKAEYLRGIVDAYLFKDIFALEGLRNAKKVRDICRLLAWQIGHEVSVSEIANAVELSRNTVYAYLDLLEKAFVLLRVGGFSRNLRNELKKQDRYYFWDNGVRNALIDNFTSLKLRNDAGQLWENFVVLERIKKLAYDKIYRHTYFWRTHDQKEIDWVEEGEGKLWGYEIHWGDTRLRRAAVERFTTAYAGAVVRLINQDNVEEFVL